MPLDVQTEAPPEIEIRATTVITTLNDDGELKRYLCDNCGKTAFEYSSEIWQVVPGRPDYPGNYKVYECRGKMRVGNTHKSSVCHWRYYVK